MGYPAILKRIVLYTVSGTLTLIAALTIAALTPRKWGELPTSGTCNLKIYISGDLMHVNLFVPVRTAVFDWGKRLALEEIGGSSAQHYRYLQFGWGDRIWYTQTPSWEEFRLTNALRALFAPNNASALLVKGHAAVPKYPNEEIKCIHLGQADYLALMNFLDTSFQTDQQGNKLRIQSGQDGQSGFYVANGTYSVVRTCNSWAADGLRAANVNTPVWAGLAPAVMRLASNGCSCQVFD